jgi:hypothetical protein
VACCLAISLGRSRWIRRVIQNLFLIVFFIIVNSSKLFAQSIFRPLQARISGCLDILPSSGDSLPSWALLFYPGLESSSGRQTLGVLQGNLCFSPWPTRVCSSGSQYQPTLTPLLQVKCSIKLLPSFLTYRYMRARMLFQLLGF